MEQQLKQQNRKAGSFPPKAASPLPKGAKQKTNLSVIASPRSAKNVNTGHRKHHF
jgi:hypothetical protein